MTRKRITEIFPFLIPLRKKQRKICFYLKMKLDNNKYSTEINTETLPNRVSKVDEVMINENSGYDITYQQNKVHNLKLASKTINKVLIKPNETFSFWKLVKDADKYEPYKDGLILVNGAILGSYGGGLCQLSNLLFELFLHSPLTIVERHGHTVQSFPPKVGLVDGIDATVSEGWKDLKIKNNTKNVFQTVISFDDERIYGELLCNEKPLHEYKIFNEKKSYYIKNNKVFKETSIDCKKINRTTGQVEKYNLYNNICEVGYELPQVE